MLKIIFVCTTILAGEAYATDRDYDCIVAATKEEVEFAKNEVDIAAGYTHGRTWDYDCLKNFRRAVEVYNNTKSRYLNAVKKGCFEKRDNGNDKNN